MEPLLIFSDRPNPGLYSETEARSFMNVGGSGKMFLMHAYTEQENILIWVWKFHQQCRYETLFDVSIRPKSITKLKLTPLSYGNIFLYRHHLYSVLYDKGGLIEVQELAACNTWLMAEIWAYAYKLENTQSYIARVYQITDNRHQSRLFLGYCWRLYNQTSICHAPLFYDCFEKIKRIKPNELIFEMVETGEVIFHNNLRWKVYEYEKDKFFTQPTTCQLQINPIINP